MVLPRKARSPEDAKLASRPSSWPSLEVGTEGSAWKEHLIWRLGTEFLSHLRPLLWDLRCVRQSL